MLSPVNAGLVDLERRGEDPAVGRDEVAGLEGWTMSPGTSWSIGKLDERAVASVPRLDDHHLLERLDLLAEALPSWLRPIAALRSVSPMSIDAGRDLGLDEQAEHAGREEHDLHRVLVLAQERLPARLLGGSANLFDPKLARRPRPRPT